ncbi:MAG: Dps family protein [Planctomycetota bacterium]
MSSADVIKGLNGLLADSVVFYHKLHNYHWNVRGPGFFTLHEVFEKLYTEWATVSDDLAERVLALGSTPLPTLAAVLEHASLGEETGSPNAEGMVASVLQDLTAQRDRMLAVSEVAQASGDKTTENLLDDFIDAIAKHAWMMSAYLDKTTNQS